MSKGQLEDFAIFGGEAAFAEKLYVGRPNIGNRELLLQRINSMLDNRWLSNDGPLVAEFERCVAEYVGVKHCIAMCNATIALEIVTRALELKGEVIIPSFTFIATAHALAWQRITPVFCDIEPEQHLLDPSRVERAITSRTTGIIGVHLWGRVCDVQALTDIANRHNLKLLFDAAHAFGCSHNGQRVGSFGNAEIFSFHATKLMNTFEGGAVVTNDDELARKVRVMKNFGFTYWDEVGLLGTNGKMTEVSAAMGLTSFESLQDFIGVNYENYKRYERNLANIPGLRLVPYDAAEDHNYQYIVLELDNEQAGLSRDQLVHVLWTENVIARRYFYPGCHRMEPYLTKYPDAASVLPVTEKISERVLALPTGTAVCSQDIDTICEIIAVAIAHAKQLKPHLEGTPPPFNRPVEVNVTGAREN
jgi:dTDP-4-amino-4,6-dideoxygalactose transaminase